MSLPSSAKPISSGTSQQICAQDLDIDAAGEVGRISEFIRETLVRELKKRGAVIGLSGGIDSSVTAALCAKALGSERVVGILMPERHSASESSRLGKFVADSLNIESIEHDISPILEAAGCYARQDEAIHSIVPRYEPGFPFKIVLPTIGSNESYRLFSLVVKMPDGSIVKERMSHDSYLRLVAATNFKQRARKMLEYYYADRFNYAVAGSPNRLEYDQGFFVKIGDGSADFKPIAHLYKTQVYALARHLHLPDEICSRPPTTDTYPMEQSQEEFYFSVSYDKMDLCLYAKNHGFPPDSVCRATQLTPDQASRVYTDIDTKRRTTRYQHLDPFMIEILPSVGKQLS